jgi:hypothetical protein
MARHRDAEGSGYGGMGFELAENYDPFGLESGSSAAVGADAFHIIVLLCHCRNDCSPNPHSKRTTEKFIDAPLSRLLIHDSIYSLAIKLQ